MRKQPTPAEALLWSKVRNSALGVRFRRQHAIDRFIVDFVCLRAMLVVELDGSSHAGLEGRVNARDRKLAELGYQVLRFTNDDVTSRLNSTLIRISDALHSDSKSTEPSSPLPAFPEAPERGQGARSR
jgi:very-short-patch-repair endonuclease